MIWEFLSVLWWTIVVFSFFGAMGWFATQIKRVWWKWYTQQT